LINGLELGLAYFQDPFGYFRIPQKDQALLIAWHNKRTQKQSKKPQNQYVQDLHEPSTPDALERARYILGMGGG